jgi:hypothetical protein
MTRLTDETITAILDGCDWRENVYPLHPNTIRAITTEVLESRAAHAQVEFQKAEIDRLTKEHRQALACFTAGEIVSRAVVHENAALTARVAELEAENASTGRKDKHGQIIRLGDRVRYRKEGNHTKVEFWNPEYEVVWEAPTFALKHVGGGKCGGSTEFILKHGGGNGGLEIIARAALGRDAT